MISGKIGVGVSALCGSRPVTGGSSGIRGKTCAEQRVEADTWQRFCRRQNSL